MFALLRACWMCLDVAGWALRCALRRFTLGFIGRSVAAGLAGWTFFVDPKHFYPAMSTCLPDIAFVLH
jgi:hypothetical protein